MTDRNEDQKFAADLFDQDDDGTTAQVEQQRGPAPLSNYAPKEGTSPEVRATDEQEFVVGIFGRGD